MQNNSPRLRLYSLSSYDRAAKVRWLLTELGVPFEDRRLSREKKEHESPEFLKLNPMGRIPVLEFDDQVIFESGAICAYLADRFSDKGLAPKIGSPERALYQQWMFFSSATLDTCQVRIMVIEDIPPGDVQATKQALLQSDFRDAMTTLDRVLSKNAYLVGGRLSAADICVSYHVYWCSLWPELDVVLQDFPNVMKYVERMKGSASAVKADVFSYQG